MYLIEQGYEPSCKTIKYIYYWRRKLRLFAFVYFLSEKVSGITFSTHMKVNILTVMGSAI